MLYSYLNLESTKTKKLFKLFGAMLYSYLNLESTKTMVTGGLRTIELYSYLNLESTKTRSVYTDLFVNVVQLLKS